MFAVAHIGQGVAPFSLFPLALVLGYLYQRTHRIVPSIVCHALFNATSLLALWASNLQQLPPTLPAN
jgi:membrane protease YdiL (CAAX protease family)